MKICKRKMDIVMANACLTINDLQELSGVSRISIGKYINGKVEPKPITVGKIAKALNVPVTDIIEDAAATVETN